MKKRFVVVVAVLLVALTAVSCTHHTCPAYRGSIAMVSE